MTAPNSQTSLGTIGFAGRNAQSFFVALREFGVSTLIDIRRNNTSQLAGYTKKSDLPFLVEEICGAQYQHVPELSPAPYLIRRFRSHEIRWPEFAEAFVQQLKTIDFEKQVSSLELHRSCLLCACNDYRECHRRIVAELLVDHVPGLVPVHL